MTTRKLPSVEYLRKRLRYDPETGKLYWLARSPDMFNASKNTPESVCKTWNARYSGKEAFTYTAALGYMSGSVDNVLFLAHRICWALHYGNEPEGVIDHIDGDPTNNRIANLRAVTQSTNMKNARRKSPSSGGRIGVYFDARYGTWYARVGRKHLGTFSCRFDAVLARLNAEKAHGFTMRHGT